MGEPNDQLLPRDEHRLWPACVGEGESTKPASQPTKKSISNWADHVQAKRHMHRAVNGLGAVQDHITSHALSLSLSRSLAQSAQSAQIDRNAQGVTCLSSTGMHHPVTVQRSIRGRKHLEQREDYGHFRSHDGTGGRSIKDMDNLVTQRLGG